MKPMVPDAKERAIQWPDRSTYGLPLEGAIELQDRAYRDGFAACLAMLREPSDELVNKVAGTDPKWCGPTTWQRRDRAKTDLRAAADAIDSGEE